MLLRNVAEKILHFANLKGGKPNRPASVDLRVERAKGSLLSCNIVVEKSLDDVLGTAFDLEHDGRVRGN